MNEVQVREQSASDGSGREYKYKKVNKEDGLLPGFYSWWGIRPSEHDLSRALSETERATLRAEKVSVANYISRYQSSNYGNNCFYSSYGDILESYAKSRKTATEQLCFKVGGTLRYRHEICHVVIVCKQDDTDLSSHATILDDTDLSSYATILDDTALSSHATILDDTALSSHATILDDTALSSHATILDDTALSSHATILDDTALSSHATILDDTALSSHATILDDTALSSHATILDDTALSSHATILDDTALSSHATILDDTALSSHATIQDDTTPSSYAPIKLARVLRLKKQGSGIVKTEAHCFQPQYVITKIKDKNVSYENLVFAFYFQKENCFLRCQKKSVRRCSITHTEKQCTKTMRVPGKPNQCPNKINKQKDKETSKLTDYYCPSKRQCLFQQSARN